MSQAIYGFEPPPDVAQCGYCQSEQIMGATALLQLSSLAAGGLLLSFRLDTELMAGAGTTISLRPNAWGYRVAEFPGPKGKRSRDHAGGLRFRNTGISVVYKYAIRRPGRI